MFFHVCEKEFSHSNCQLITSLCVCAQSYQTLCDTMNCSLPGSSVDEITQARMLEQVAISYSKGPWHPGIEPTSPALTGRFFTTAAPDYFIQFSSVQSLSRVWLFATPWTAACQPCLSITNSQSLLKLMSIESVIPSNRLILCCPLLLLPSIFPSIEVFSNESVLCIRWPKYWSFSFSISPSSEYSGLISFRMDWLDLLLVQGFSRAFSNTTVQKHQFFGTQLSSWSNSHIHTRLLEKP